MFEYAKDDFDLILKNRGFLPSSDPITKLPREFGLWEEIAHDLPKLLSSGGLRKILEEMPVFEAGQLKSYENQRAMLLLSFLGHGYIWATFHEPASVIPKSIAVPWFLVSQAIGRPPVLSYASYALYNWSRFDKSMLPELGNAKILQNFLGGLDEDWFILIHIDIESKAGPILESGHLSRQNMSKDRLPSLAKNLFAIYEALEKMYKTLLRMPEGCDPYIYYNRVRPYIHGFTQHPVIYEGVREYAGAPQKFFGETGAQSSIIPYVDAVLGIEHEDGDELDKYLLNMRQYMPPYHRKILEDCEKGPLLHDFVKNNWQDLPEIKDYYNGCIRLLGDFLSKHLEYAASYIHKQSQAGVHNPTGHGTGGTPFMAYLKKHLEKRKQYIIE